ncbi:hypothetical protein [Pedobacter terrae]|uniref:hypothetical protein n=1 Tax=Pedobacter terrae TaxID=405671 RepID=UPI002FF8D1D6
MRITIAKLSEVMEMIPDGTNLPNGATHTINIADPMGEIPRSFYTGETDISFIWSTGLGEWTLELPKTDK